MTLKFYLKTLNPKKTQWKHFIFQIDFLLMNLLEIPAVCEQRSVLLWGGLFRLYFRHHVYLITNGSIVTQQYYFLCIMHYVILSLDGSHFV